MILITCSCAGIGSWAENDHRVFRSVDGRSIAGRLTGYNPDGQIATVARHDGKEFQVLLELFSESDQQYIREQSAVMDFMRSIRITPKLKTYDASGGSDDTSCKEAYVKALGYVISLKNLSPTLFKEIEIEYCLFYRQGERHEAVMEFQHGVQYDRWSLDSMAPGSVEVLETEQVLIYDTGSTCTLLGNDSRAQGGVDGIWLRIAATLPTGARVFREIQTPVLTGSHHNWVSTSIPAGLNNRHVSVAHF
jgi:hypothetical protein